MAFQPAEHSSLYELEFPAPSVSKSTGAGPVLVHALDGFADAGNAVALAASHLRDSLDSELVATFHPDELIDYRSRRPVVDFSGQAFTGIEMPSLTVHAIRDNTGEPFLLLSGAEPDLRWEQFSAAVRGLSDRFGVSDVVGLNAIPMAVPHTRPSTITAHGSDVEFLGDMPRWGSPMKLPGSASMMLELRLSEHGYRTSGLSVHVPHYLAQSTYPAASSRLLSGLSALTGLELPTAALDNAADSLRVQVDKELANNEEVSSVVAALESQYDSYTAATEQQASLLAADEPLPSADEIGDEFQRYLAEQARQSGDGGADNDGPSPA
ncbi:PAC2 family protein [Gordonia defluvii]|jgi:predicted ATP-grasp superfamily ATP-dependent carboligase|uniref:PAC2 family protein n=1 Tax=Gordonia defluvii TaxID=283718 RepID=A0ABP6LC72_9ACTN|nr:PAC2 family protein [Gordonia sp. UBA5067]